MAILRCFAFLLFNLVVVFAKEPEVNCPAPKSPENGQIFYDQEGSVVKYVCEPGYVIIGREMVRCIDGQWEEPIPFCLEVTAAETLPLTDPSGTPDAAPAPRPLFDWNGQEENATGEGDMLQSDEARLRMVIMPKRRARLFSRLRSVSEIEEEAKKRSDAKSTTTLHLEAPPSVVYIRHTGKSGTATVDNGLRVLPRAAVAQNDKGDESLRQSYWLARQYYHPSLAEYSPVVRTLSDSQMAWINSLHPELRDQYLRDLYVLRAEHVGEGARALSFLRRHDDGYHYYYRQPLSNQNLTPLYDYSCNQAGSHFVTAPKLTNAHIARYDSRQNPYHPYNHYLTAVYRCDPGYVMLDSRFTELTCSRRQWIGTEPICVRST